MESTTLSRPSQRGFCGLWRKWLKYNTVKMSTKSKEPPVCPDNKNYHGVAQSKAVIFFILVAVLALAQQKATRSKEVQQ